MTIGRQRLRRAAVIVSALLTLTTAAVPVATAEPKREIVWAPCAENPAASCGTIELPVDWSQPDGARFELAVAKVPATDPARRVGALFVNPGGPGGSGVSMALNSASVFTAELRSRFDIVGIDPRGVARSHPVVCSRTALDRPGDTLLPRSDAEFDALLAYNRQLAEDCRQQTGPLFDHVDSVAVARDLDAVREAMGERLLNWYGVSYGTLTGQMYAELYPKRIRSLAQDSNMDHSLSTWPFLLSEAAFVEDSFRQFVAWCDRSTNCAAHGEDLDAIWSSLLERADAGTLVDPADGHVVTAWELLGTTEFFFNRPRWTELGQLWAALHDGTTPPLSVRTVLRALRPVADDEELVPDVRAQFCEDWTVSIDSFRELDSLWRVSQRVAPNMRTSSNALGAIVSCLGWEGSVNNPQHALRVSGAPRIVMLNGKHDPATGYGWAINVERQLRPQAVLVTYEGAGHGAYRRNDCTRGVTDRYLIDLTVPAKGTTCPASDPAIATTRGSEDLSDLHPNRPYWALRP